MTNIGLLYPKVRTGGDIPIDVPSNQNIGGDVSPASPAVLTPVDTHSWNLYQKWEIFTRNLLWHTWPTFYGLIGWLRMKVSDTRNLHQIELRSIHHIVLYRIGVEDADFGASLSTSL